MFLLFCSIANFTVLNFPFWVVSAIPFLSSLISYVAISTAIEKTTFCEWDYTERKKRNRFILGYAFIANALSVMLLFSVAVVYICIKDGCGISSAVLLSFPVVFFAFNLLNIVSLFYPLFEKDLTIGYKMQKRPENWQESGREINNDDEINEIMRRDFGI